MPSTMMRPDRRRWIALGGISLGLLAVGLDATVLGLALPTLSDALHASESQLQWFVTAYTLSLTAAMLPVGLVGDRYGRRRVMLAALLLFGVASAACAWAPGPEVFILARCLLGLAGAAMIVMALSVITVLFDEAERPRAIGVWAAMNFLSLPLGPIVGGWLLANAWWGWVFLLNLPVVAIGLLAVARVVPESRADRRPSIDWLGVAGSSIGLTMLMYGIIQAGDIGWTAPGTVGPLAAGAIVLAAFIAWEMMLSRAGRQPLVDLDLFRHRGFAMGVVLAGIGIFGLFGLLFTLPQFWQGVLGLDAQVAGLRLLPAILGMAAGAIPADRIVARLGPKVVVAAGLAMMAAATFVGSTTTASSVVAFEAAWTFAVGLGTGLALSTAAGAAMVELDAEHSGVGSALVQAVVKLGPAIGAAVLGSVLNAGYQAAVPVAGLPADAASAVEGSLFGGLAVARAMGSADLAAAVQAAFMTGMADALRVTAAIAGVGVLLALALMPRRSRALSPDAAQSRHEPAITAA
jgi:MFS transporter, DHA2 family, multidrug resistance protein